MLRARELKVGLAQGGQRVGSAAGGQPSNRRGDAQAVRRGLEAHQDLWARVEGDYTELVARVQGACRGPGRFLHEIEPVLAGHGSALVDDQHERQRRLFTLPLAPVANGQDGLDGGPPPAAHAEGVLAADHDEATAELLDVVHHGALLLERDTAARNVREHDQVVTAQTLGAGWQLAGINVVDLEVIRSERARKRATGVSADMQHSGAPPNLSHGGRLVIELAAVLFIRKALGVQPGGEGDRPGPGHAGGELDLLPPASKLELHGGPEGVGRAVLVEVEQQFSRCRCDHVDGDLEALTHAHLVREVNRFDDHIAPRARREAPGVDCDSFALQRGDGSRQPLSLRQVSRSIGHQHDTALAISIEERRSEPQSGGMVAGEGVVRVLLDP
jgi:hypothetical protein